MLNKIYKLLFSQVILFFYYQKNNIYLLYRYYYPLNILFSVSCYNIDLYYTRISPLCKTINTLQYYIIAANARETQPPEEVLYVHTTRGRQVAVKSPPLGARLIDDVLMKCPGRASWAVVNASLELDAYTCVYAIVFNAVDPFTLHHISRGLHTACSCSCILRKIIKITNR